MNGKIDLPIIDRLVAGWAPVFRKVLCATAGWLYIMQDECLAITRYHSVAPNHVTATLFSQFVGTDRLKTIA